MSDSIIIKSNTFPRAIGKSDVFIGCQGIIQEHELLSSDPRATWDRFVSLKCLNVESAHDGSGKTCILILRVSELPN